MPYNTSTLTSRPSVASVPQMSLFWGKAKRVVNTKVAVEAEARKKEVLGKSLDLILGQTEKYSKMLAKNLAATPDGGGGGGPTLPLLLPPAGAAMTGAGAAPDGSLQAAAAPTGRCGKVWGGGGPVVCC